jgi:surfactin synthase thioesterase subunit
MKYCFIFPHAGALRSDYKNIIKSLDEDFKCFYYSREESDDDVWGDNIKSSYDFILKNIENYDGDYIILGHSMGAMQAYFTVTMLEDKEVRLPSNLILSSMFPPTMSNIKELENLIELDEEGFTRVILKLGGIPKQILERKDFLNFFMNRIKNDINKMKDIEMSSKKLKSKIICLAGEDDHKYSFLEMNEWSNYTTNSFDIKVFKGGHFYIINLYKEVTEYIKKMKHEL